MSIIKINKCDACGKTSFDYMKDGWYEVQRLVKYGGRKKNGSAFTEIYRGPVNEFHFCSDKCLLKKNCEENT